MSQTDLIPRLTADLPITAGSFIVTVYGDVVVPRGEVLWIGSLIAICARIGIRENLVRTAVSRLVAADRLEGTRVGRRSFYRLAPAARAEFADAARLLYARTEPSGDWLVMLAPDMPEDLARRHRMARMGGDLWLCPARNGLPDAGGLVLVASPVAGLEHVPQLAGFWDLETLADGYRVVLDRFRPLADDLALSPEDALTARLLLVHQYRGVLLRDPGLPAAALPSDWPGTMAQALFRSLYIALSPLAEAHIARVMEGEDGPLPRTTPRTQARLTALG
ncbi:PaaX family transcriptional regulator [Paracoccus sediminis]|uniref:PaaX family transcriptional regulator n=1 Tax=Paracoccus sediminis TaxID=1214787 RepID=A0A238WKD1_9RHOB|nr:PaaX family transcriptional regulator C-terminal domain-containing protein [Paracoccus sediminis]TBN50542.1 PaaX family transcriptional regulator [Paracoccus sediminis]SNR46801.1 transcriptional regulator, PaaX family [Paracoccus sediminis]